MTRLFHLSDCSALLCLLLIPTAQYPSLDGWADTLFYSVIDTLYDAAALDAVTSVGEAYIDTAIRLAIFATPIVSCCQPVLHVAV
jgi:hypothetical protein